jgi:hypothetical protein
MKFGLLGHSGKKKKVPHFFGNFHATTHNRQLAQLKGQLTRDNKQFFPIAK